LFVLKQNLETVATYSGIASIIASLFLLLYLVNADYVSVVYFHIGYLLTLGFLSVHLVISTILGKGRLAVLTVVTVMVCFGLLSTASVPYPIMGERDVKFELQTVNNILSTGVVPWGQGTGFALDFSYFPALEIVVSSLSLVSLIPQVVLMKYAGSFLCIVTTILLLRVYSRISSKKSCGLATALAALSPWFVAFDASMVHQTLALLFLGVVLLSACEPIRIEWVLVAMLGMVGISITHPFTSCVLVVLLVLLKAMTWHSGKRVSTNLPNLTKITILAAALIVLFWNFFVALAYLPNILNFLMVVSEFLVVPQLTLGTLAMSQSTGVKPFWVFAVTAMGLATYFFIAVGIFLKAVVRRNAQKRNEVRFALIGFLVFGVILVPWVTGLQTSTDLQGRALIYLYFLTAPLVAGFFVRQLMGVTQGSSILRLRRTSVMVALVFIILIPTVYYGVNPAHYDRTSPIVLSSDFRLSVGEWQAAADFSRMSVSAHDVYGVSLARDFIGALASKEVSFTLITGNETLREWTQLHPGELLFLRNSITRTPDVTLRQVSENDLLSTMERANILYSSGEVIILESR